jgi:hypothetical protein
MKTAFSPWGAWTLLKIVCLLNSNLRLGDGLVFRGGTRVRSLLGQIGPSSKTLLRSLQMFDQAFPGRRQILEAAHADFQFANGPRICEIELSHLHNSLRTEKYRFRDDSKAHALLYHSTDILECRQSNPNVEPSIKTVRFLCEKPLDRTSFTEPDKFVFKRFQKGNSATFAHGMILGKGKH